MRVIIIGPAWPYRGGIASFSERLAREFLREQCEVELVTFTLQYPSLLFPGTTQYTSDPAPADLTIRRMISSVNPLSWIRAGRYIRRQAPDIVVCAYWMSFMAPCLGTVMRIARRGHTRRIGILHNLVPHERHPGDNMLARYFVRSCDGFVTLSRSVLDELDHFDAQHQRQRIFSPHPLYDNYGERETRSAAAAALGLDEDMRYLLFFGLIRDYKGLDLLMQAYADSRIDKSRVRLIVAGEHYGDSSRYTALEQELKLQGHIVWHTHFIANDDVRHYFSLADLVVQPYKSATQSGVTQIAYHFEKPMLVTRVGGLSEIVPHGRVGYVCDVDAASIADALVDFLTNGTPDRFHAAIVEEKQKYAWPRMTQAIRHVAFVP